MKWLIGVFAAVMFVGSAHAKEVSLSFQAKRNECRWYQGSFDSYGAREPQIGALPKIACKLVDGVGVRCVMKEHGLEKNLPTYMVFNGNFRDYGPAFDLGPDGDVMLSEVGPFAFQIKCHQGSGCLMRFWNIQAELGYSCNLMPWTEASAKPVPKPPELLRNPERKDAPPAWKAPEVESYKL